MISRGYEVNFDGIVGQTHNYSGLSKGNIASMSNQNTVSNPKQAALQGLEKMKFIHSLGMRQGVFPPHERPHIPSLRALGFTGPDRLIPEKVYQVMPFLLYNYSSASPMWAANSATFTPSTDTIDNKLHITLANLCRTNHRSFEAETTKKILRAIFPSNAFFTHHPSLPYNTTFGDEGSANHIRFCKDYGEVGVHLFVYGESALEKKGQKPGIFPARQTLEACEAIVRAHRIPLERVIFAQQSPKAIDEGVFHNDVISAGDKNFFFYYENAFVNTEQVIDKIRKTVKTNCEVEMQFIKVTEKDLILKTAVQTYLFNSQIISLTEKTFTLVAPIECRRSTVVHDYLEKLRQNPVNPLTDIHYIDTTQSMRNGGGPACLRTQVVMNPVEFTMVNPKVIYSEELYQSLHSWINKHYRDSLKPSELQDPHLVDEVQDALNELTRILGLGNIYSFQL